MVIEVYIVVNIVRQTKIIKKNLILCADIMFTAFLIQNIGNYQARFERFIKGRKMDEFEVLGYARKSLHDFSNEVLKKVKCFKYKNKDKEELARLNNSSKFKYFY